MKLVYIAHGWMLCLYRRPLISDPIEAWRYGPVIPNLYRAMKQYGGGSVTHELSPIGSLDDAETDLVQQVYERYGSLNGLQLSALTHRPGTPWHQAWAEVGQNAPISNDLIAEHYRQLANEQSSARP